MNRMTLYAYREMGELEVLLEQAHARMNEDPRYPLRSRVPPPTVSYLWWCQTEGTSPIDGRLWPRSPLRKPSART